MAATAERHELGRRSPPFVRAFDDPPQQRHEPGDRQQCTDGIEARRRRILRFRDEQVAEHEGGDDDGHVHQEDRAPPEVRQQEPAGDGAEAHTECADARPHTDGLRSFAVVLEDVREDRQGRRHDERATDAHEPAGDDEYRRRRSRGRYRRTHAEDGQPECEPSVAAEAVTETARGEQQPGEDDRVGVDDPLQLAAFGVQAARGHRLRERRDRDVENGVVEPDHHQAQAEHQQRVPAIAIRDVGILQSLTHGPPRLAAPQRRRPTYGTYPFRMSMANRIGLRARVMRHLRESTLVIRPDPLHAPAARSAHDCRGGVSPAVLTRGP